MYLWMEWRGKVVGEDGGVKQERDVTDIHPEGDLGLFPLHVFVVWEFGGLRVGGIQDVEDVHDGGIPSVSCGRLAEEWVKEEKKKGESDGAREFKEVCQDRERGICCAD